MASRRKRKIEDDNRTFQVEWEKLYFFTQVNDKAMFDGGQSFDKLKLHNLKRLMSKKHVEISSWSYPAPPPPPPVISWGPR